MQDPLTESAVNQEDLPQSEADLHELSQLFKVDEDSDKRYRVHLTAALQDPIYLTLPSDYPQKPPQIQVASKFSPNLAYIVNSSTNQVIIEDWSAESSLVDLVMDLNIHLHKITCQQVAVPVDYAYPPQSKEHLGIYDLSCDVKLKTRRALYDFEAADENELAINVGDIVEVLYERSDGWLVGILNGISGLVPQNHLESAQDAPIADSTHLQTQSSSTKKSEDALNIIEQTQSQDDEKANKSQEAISEPAAGQTSEQ